jgi:hypothetical protein
MDEKQRLLEKVLDMDDMESKAALIYIVNGMPVVETVEKAYNQLRRSVRKCKSAIKGG